MIGSQRSAITFVVGAVAALLLVATSPIFTRAPRAQAPAPERFDNVVRADFFAGFRGDAARLERGMKRCEETLAVDPDHPDALVWHGAGLMFMAGEAQARQDFETARARATRGREELDRAESLAPDSLSVMLVRAVVLNASAPRVSDRARGQAMQKSAVEGFERALAIQTPYFERLSEHSRGELLAGLAEGWSRLGETDKARTYLERIVKELPDSRYQARARAWLEDGPQAGSLTCLTCHHQ
jgi:tetratricopeptide (TPR) repeat protein